MFGCDETGSKTSELQVVNARQTRGAQMRAVVEVRCPKLFLTSLLKGIGVEAQKLNLHLPVMDQPDRVTKVVSFSEITPVNMRAYDKLTPFWGEGS